MTRRILVIDGRLGSDVRAVLDALASTADLEIGLRDGIIYRQTPAAPMRIDIGPVPSPIAAFVRDAPRRGPERPVRPPPERVRGIARRKR